MNSTLQRRAPGLTLIETLVALLVVGVLVAVAAPSMQQFIAAQRVKGVNAEIVTDLQFARSEASRRNRDVLVQFRNGADNCYVVYVVTGVGFGCDCSLTPGNVCSGGHEEIKTVKVPVSTGVAIEATSATGNIIVFEPSSGQQRFLDEFRVSVVSTRGGSLLTSVNAAGRPSVCSPDGSVTSVSQCSP